MAKAKTEVEETLSDREVRWSNFEESYKKQNPSKYELRKEEGFFDKIPDSFE